MGLRVYGLGLGSPAWRIKMEKEMENYMEDIVAYRVSCCQRYGYQGSVDIGLFCSLGKFLIHFLSGTRVH